MKIFYSWQSDIKPQKNQIEKSLSKSIKRIAKEIDVEIALDRDTKNSSGSTDIADEILRKINKASIFIADVTFINNNLINKILKKEKYPNPNVLIELGYAVRKIGWDRIIMIFNQKYGNVEELPFDLKHRRVLSFSDVTKELENDLHSAINLIINKNGTSIIPDRDLEELHDIDVFNRIMKNIPEDDLPYMLRWISNNGYYNYDDTNFIFEKFDDLKQPKNKFLNENINNKAYLFGECLKNLSIFLAFNFSPHDRNTKLARINQFEGVPDYSERDRLFFELNDKLFIKTEAVIESFGLFRLEVKKYLKI